MSIIFLMFVAIMAILVLVLTAKHQTGRATVVMLVTLLLWLIYVGLMSYFGLLKNLAKRLPGAAFILIPVLLILAWAIFKLRSTVGRRFAWAFPLWIILGLQVFRVGVELVLHQLWKVGLSRAC